MSYKVDIVLPCYNPSKNWIYELSQFYDLAKLNYDCHFFVINDGSTNDNLLQQLETLKAKKIPVQFFTYEFNKGKGFALRYGVSKTQAPIVIYTDIDFPFTNQSTIKLIEALHTNEIDVVVGHRNENYYQKKMSKFRKGLSKSFRFFIRRFLNMQISDTQCGLKGFNQKGKEKFLQTTINRYLFDFEFIYAISNDVSIRIKPIEVQLKENVSFSKMRIKILIQETINLIQILIKTKSK